MRSGEWKHGLKRLNRGRTMCYSSPATRLRPLRLYASTRVSRLLSLAFGGRGVMTDEQWRACAEPDEMLIVVDGRATDQQLRLWCCACVRRVWHRLARAEAGRRAVEVAEAFARGDASA